MGLLKEFKEFALRGNVVDMAVGIIIGGAFGKIVTSLVGDVIMPPIGKLLSNVDFADLFLNLSDQPYDSVKAAQEAGAPTLRYGLFLNEVINFAIVALCMFAVIKLMNTLLRKKAEAPAPPEPTAQEKLLTEIRALLRVRA